MLIATLLPSDPQHSLLQDIASPKFSTPSPVRTVIAADFDNDQELEVFFNNIAYRSSSANRLFRYQTQAMAGRKLEGRIPRVREAVLGAGRSGRRIGSQGNQGAVLD